MQTLAVGHCLRGSLSCSVVSLWVSLCCSWRFSLHVKTSLMFQLKGDRKAKTSMIIILDVILEALWTHLWADGDIVCACSKYMFTLLFFSFFLRNSYPDDCYWREACWEMTPSESLYRLLLQSLACQGGGGGCRRRCRADEPWKCFQWRGRQSEAQRCWLPLSLSPTRAVRFVDRRINIIKVMPQEVCGCTFTPALTHTAMTKVSSLFSSLSVWSYSTKRNEIIASLLVPNNAKRRLWVWFLLCSV